MNEMENFRLERLLTQVQLKAMHGKRNDISLGFVKPNDENVKLKGNVTTNLAPNNPV